jgi:hypothetical protein
MTRFWNNLALFTWKHHPNIFSVVTTIWYDHSCVAIPLSSHFDDIGLGKGDIATDAKLLMKVIPESVVRTKFDIYVL